MTMTGPPPAAGCEDGKMAPQGAHCCESARSPPIGRMGLTCPRVTIVPERLITSMPTWSSRPCCTEHAPGVWATSAPEGPAMLSLEE